MVCSILVQWAACKVNSMVLLTYAKPSEFEYVSIAGRAQVVEDRQKVKQLWNEGLRVWFPKGPEDPEIALIAVEVERAKYWTDVASTAAYAWAYVRSRVTGKSPAPDDIAEMKDVRF
jgi:general stress protein 26